MNNLKWISLIEAHELTQNWVLTRREWYKNIKILIGAILSLQSNSHLSEAKKK